MKRGKRNILLPIPLPASSTSSSSSSSSRLLLLTPLEGWLSSLDGKPAWIDHYSTLHMLCRL